ncbi:MAG: GerAB/ArcD/ProY family transporter, partial [Clostridia bacterium]|nr:GerAB/ArcD/ProY family transporter [Clostridia bacterium]
LYIYSTKGFDFYNIFPILGNGPDKFLYSISLSGYFSDFIIISFLLPFTKEKTNYCKIVKPSFIVSSVMLVITVAVYILTVPYNTKVSFFIPVYRIAQYIDYGSFISRLESIFTISWILCFFAYSALQLYIMSMIAGRIFLSINNRPAIAFFAIIITIFSLLPSNTAQLVKISKLFEIPRLTVFIILPIVILLSAYRKEVKK